MSEKVIPFVFALLMGVAWSEATKCANIFVLIENSNKLETIEFDVMKFTAKKLLSDLLSVKDAGLNSVAAYAFGDDIQREQGFGFTDDPDIIAGIEKKFKWIGTTAPNIGKAISFARDELKKGDASARKIILYMGIGVTSNSGLLKEELKKAKEDGVKVFAADYNHAPGKSSLAILKLIGPTQSDYKDPLRDLTEQMRLQCKVCPRKKTAIVVILENSNRVSSTQYDAMKVHVGVLFIKLLDGRRTQIGVHSFGNDVYKDKSIGLTDDFLTLMNGVHASKYNQPALYPHIDKAIKQGRETLKAVNDDTEKVMVFVGTGTTDNSDLLTAELKKARDERITMFAMSVGDGDQTNLKRIVDQSLSRLNPFTKPTKTINEIVAFTTPNCDTCYKSPIDVAILMDNSYSIGEQRYSKMKELVKRIVQKFEIASRDYGVRFSVVPYEGKVNYKQAFMFNKYSDMASLEKGVDGLKFLASRKQSVAQAVLFTNQFVFAQARPQEEVKKIMIIVTDAMWSHDDPNGTDRKVKVYAKTARDRGTKIITVGFEGFDADFTAVAGGDASSAIDARGVSGDQTKLLAVADSVFKRVCHIVSNRGKTSGMDP